jgi:hypothetical protein
VVSPWVFDLFTVALVVLGIATPGADHGSAGAPLMPAAVA